MTKTEAIEKIRKCLALAQSDNLGEREAALRQARKLMEQYTVGLDDVHAAECERMRLGAGVVLSKRCKPATKRQRGDEFAHGFVDGVRDVVARFAGRTEEADRAIQAFVRQHYASAQTAQVGRGRQLARDASSRSAGRSAGSDARLRHGVGSERSRPAGLLEREE